MRTPTKYRIEPRAMQFNDFNDFHEIAFWLRSFGKRCSFEGESECMTVFTLNGYETVRKGNWVVFEDNECHVSVEEPA